MKAVVAAFSAAAVLAATAGGAVYLTASVPDGRTVQALTSGAVLQTVTCKTACTITTRVGVKPSVARTLGFARVRKKQSWHWIGTTRATLKGGQPTKLHVVVTAEAKRLLVRSRRDVQVLGEIRAVPRSTPGANYSTVWITTLRPAA